MPDHASLQLFLPCAGGAESLLEAEIHRIMAHTGARAVRGGAALRGSWQDALRLNLHSRIAQRVLVQLAHAPYRSEQDIYDLASGMEWEAWFTPRQSFRVETTARHSPLQSLNFATLRVKDAVVDRFRSKSHARPDVERQWPKVRIHLHLTADQATLYIDTSGEPLFKRGWRESKGDAPLKETLAAALLAATGWQPHGSTPQPLYDPCCGSGTIAIEAAQIACHMAPGMLRRFGFEHLLPWQPNVWADLKAQAQAAITAPAAPVFGSDVAHRMVDFAQRNAQRAGVAHAIAFRGGDALQRMPPVQVGEAGGVILVNPPYGERIDVAGVAGAVRGGRETAQIDAPGTEEGVFFTRLAAHWKQHYAGWTAWILTPDMKLPARMRLKESRRMPMWNGPIECRLFRFDMVAGSARNR